MPIPMVDLKGQYRTIEKEIKEKIDDILTKGQFILGPNVEELEKEIARYHGVGHAVGVASGTDALHLALLACGIKAGDEVITSPFTFIATAEAIAYIGAIPIFIDIDPKTFNINTNRLEEYLKKAGTRSGGTKKSKISAILPVHLFGQAADMDHILELSRRYELKVIEDCAQSFGTSYKGKMAGSIGDAGSFSFFPSKNLGCYGDGGMVITNDKNVAEKLRLLRVHGSRVKYHHMLIGYNSRLDEIQAGILRVKLKRINEYNEKRRKVASLYSERLSPLGIGVPFESEGCYHVYHQYCILTPKREAVRQALKDNEIASEIYYPLPLHLQEAFRYLGYKKGDFPVSEDVSQNILSLPVYPELGEDDINRICDIIAQNY